jgi:hypothetical protein
MEGTGCMPAKAPPRAATAQRVPGIREPENFDREVGGGKRYRGFQECFPESESQVGASGLRGQECRQHHCQRFRAAGRRRDGKQQQQSFGKPAPHLPYRQFQWTRRTEAKLRIFEGSIEHGLVYFSIL